MTSIQDVLSYSPGQQDVPSSLTISVQSSMSSQESWTGVVGVPNYNPRPTDISTPGSLDQLREAAGPAIDERADTAEEIADQAQDAEDFYLIQVEAVRQSDT